MQEQIARPTLGFDHYLRTVSLATVTHPLFIGAVLVSLAMTIFWIADRSYAPSVALLVFAFTSGHVMRNQVQADRNRGYQVEGVFAVGVILGILPAMAGFGVQFLKFWL